MKTLFTKPIVIQLLPSSLLLGLLLAVATASCAILFIVSMHLTLKLIIFALIIMSSVFFITRDALLILPQSWQSVGVDTKGVLTLVNKRQQRFNPQLASSSFVHQYCVILNLKLPGFHWRLSPVVLLNNVDNADELRRLRVWLRFYESKQGKTLNQQIT